MTLLLGNMIFVSLALTADYGDANKDGEINIKDATSIQRHAAMLITLDEESLVLSDVDYDGNVNIKDATMIQKFLAQLIERFPASTAPIPTIDTGTDSTQPGSSNPSDPPVTDLTQATDPVQTLPDVPTPTDSTCATDPTQPPNTEQTKPSIDKDGYYDQILRP